MATRTLLEDTSDYIRFGDVARDRCGMQCQYCRHYLAGDDKGKPALGDDLRWHGDTEDYHNLMIHRDDADTFVHRVREYRTNGMMGWSGEVG